MALGDLLEAVMKNPDEPVWIVNDIGELGVIVNGRAFFLYKGENLEYSGYHDNGIPMYYRKVEKREFGEVCRVPGLPNIYDDLNARYRVGTGWLPLPIRKD